MVGMVVLARDHIAIRLVDIPCFCQDGMLYQSTPALHERRLCEHEPITWELTIVIYIILTIAA